MKQSVVIMDWIVVERVVHLRKRSNDEDQQYHDHADFLEKAHNSLFNEYPWHVPVLATSGVYMPVAPQISFPAGTRSRLLSTLNRLFSGNPLIVPLSIS